MPAVFEKQSDLNSDFSSSTFFHLFLDDPLHDSVLVTLLRFYFSRKSFTMSDDEQHNQTFEQVRNRFAPASMPHRS